MLLIAAARIALGEAPVGPASSVPSRPPEAL